ncbi:universal stress protein [Natrinema gelatinilyticum]|uniref:universal stress protein n=1 Tax=Natrinema gelatinilyticum TaxID=2961571 RepID=UPI0020C4C548|nr:universal stress protein [Natrinema gelatinilyticum]
MVRNVLVPIDQSEQATKALEYALAEYPNEHITVLHVIHLARTEMAGNEGFLYRDEFLERLNAASEERLETARERAAEQGVEIDTELIRGRPARAISEYVEENDIDHVVIGSHGRSGTSRVLLGSVAEAVTRQSPVPVTIVR